LPGAQTRPGAPVCITSPATDELHVLTADTTGRILGCHWTPNTAWTAWAPIQDGVTGPAGWVGAASRRPGQLDLVTAGADGRIYTAARDPAGQWAGRWGLTGPPTPRAHRPRRTRSASPARPAGSAQPADAPDNSISSPPEPTAASTPQPATRPARGPAGG